MRMRHWICAAALSGGLLMGGMAAFSAYATSVEIEDAKKQVSALEEEKKKVESTLNQLEGLKADTAAYVKKLDGSLSSLAEELEQLGNRITLKEEEIDQAQIQLEEARREEEHQYDSMKLRIKYMYENGQNNLLDMVMESGSISELLNRAEYVSQIAEYDRKMLTAYASAKEQVAVREQNLEKEHGELLVLQESTQAKQASKGNLHDYANVSAGEALLTMGSDTIDLDIRSKQKELDSYNSKIAMAQDELDQYNADIKAQEDQMKRIEAEMKRREEEARKKAEAAGKTYTVSNLGNISFKWPCPSSSRITSNFGDRESPTEGASSNHKGIDISASTGADIIAAADGEVVISTYSYSAGNYIMIDHGGGVSTVYMHSSKLLVGVGEKVTKGQVIAKVGSTGYSTGPHLHFGIRSGGTYVNPRSYVSP